MASLYENVIVELGPTKSKHTVRLELTQDTNENSRINIAESAADYTFSGTIQALLGFHGGVNIGIKKGPAEVGTAVTPTISSVTVVAFTITVPSSQLNQGGNTLTLFGNRPLATPSTFDFFSFDVFLDTVRPTSSFIAIASPINTSVSSATVVFSEAIVASSFGASDVTLFRNGSSVPLSGLDFSANGINRFAVGNLGNFTSAQGDYELRVANSGVTDIEGNAGNTTTSVFWTVDLDPPSFSDPPRLVSELDTGLSNSDAITMTQAGLSFLTSLDGAAGVVVRFEIRTLAGVVVSSVDGAPTAVPNQRSGVFSATISQGEYRVFAIATDAAKNTSTSSALALTIDRTSPTKPILARDNSNRKIIGNAAQPTTADVQIDVTIAEPGARVTLGRDSAINVQQRTPSPTVAINSISDSPTNGNSNGQTFRYSATQTDLAGNVSGVSDPFFAVIDSVAPVINSIALVNLDPELNSNTLAVAVTKNLAPSFNLELSEQKYANTDNTVIVEVFPSESPSVRIGATTITLASLGLTNGGAHATSSFTAKVQFDAGVTLVAGKQHSLLFKVTDAAKQVRTGTFNVFVAKESDASLSAPATPVDTTYYFMGARLVNSVQNNGKTGSTSITVNQNVRNGANIRLFNESNTDRNDRTVNAVSGTGPFVLTLDAPLQNDFPIESTKISWLRPWTMAFDKTTQTTWFSNEDGHYIGQFDPVDGSVKLYDIVLPDTGDGAPSYDPHGVFFDFNTHLTPRVWFAYRNGSDMNGDSQPTTNFERGRLGYVDVLTKELFTFDLSTIEIDDVRTPEIDPHPIEGTHAVVIDTRGHAWVSAEHSNAIIEIDLKTLVNGTGTSEINSKSGSAITHILPKELGYIGDQKFDFEVHGIQVVVDQRTNQPYVWLSDGNPRSTGRTVLLRPGSHATSPFRQSRPMDEWLEFNINEALISEKRLVENKDPNTGIPNGTFTSRAHPLFFALDDNETPGIPEDDRIIAPDSGGLRFGSAGVIRSFDPSALLDQLTKLAPTSYMDLSRLPASIPVDTTIIPKIPGSSPNNTNAAPSQGSVDRSGNIFFNDHIGSVGRLNFNDVSLTRSRINAPWRPFKSNIQVDPVTFTATTPATHSFFAERLKASSATAQDRSQVPGVDQYELAQKFPRGLGEGAFRFVLTAENTVHAALTQSDHLAVTVFAETTRRALAVVESPFELPKNARVGGRVALQVLRDGSVVLTARGDGELLDVQVNLTRELLNAGRIASFDDAAVFGDMAALGNPDGSIEALGRQGDGRLIRYSFTPPSKSWTTTDLKNAKFWTANTRLSVPTGQLVAEDPDAAPGIGFTITTSAGHLIVIPSGGVPKDLSAAAGSPAVYSGVGGIKVGDKLRFYGTNQTGSVIEYQTDLNLGNVSTRTLILPSSVDSRSTRMLRNITALFDGTTIHLFGTDGVAQLVHYELNTSGTVTLAENVTQVVQKSGQVYGYFSFLQPFGGRVYTYVSAIMQKDGTLRVYGTNGGELIEFTRDNAGKWRVGNLTFDIKSTDGVKNNSRIPANFVFGAPSVYEDKSNERHILQINADGEVIEYYTLANETQKRFHTQNINLRIGNDSLISNLRFRAAPLRTTASISSNSTTNSSTSASAGASVFAAPSVSSLDVNADGELSPLDVLIVINYLNSSVESNKVGDGESSDNRLDVNGDGWISPLDVLILVNQLNSSHSGLGEGEGEAASTDQQSISASALDFAFAELEHWDSFSSPIRKNRRPQRN